ncbi:Alpha/Beta hydrolase protein [Lyophyllum atratum]|nr:Alpha/Beta hydrolase protein [Lyophyllum atratum]
MALQSDYLVLDGATGDATLGHSLKMTAKCYTVGDSSKNAAGLTLLLTHCIGSHKEQWEPTIQRMFQVQQAKDESYRIREAWSFDWQNHGDAAVLNRDALISRPGGVCESPNKALMDFSDRKQAVYEWASAITAFVRSPRMKGHRLVGLGHSAGTGALMLTTKDFPLSRLPYAAIVLIEPAMITRKLFNAHLEDRMETMNFAVSATSVRRDTWDSRDMALRWFSKRFPWNSWDPRVVRILAEYGLRDVPPVVALKCDRKQEAVSYPDKEGHFESMTLLGRICHELPIHVVWGTRNDLIPQFIQDSLCDTTEGRFVKSVTKVKGAGHMIVQEQPERLARALCEILDSIHIQPSTRSRL